MTAVPIEHLIEDEWVDPELGVPIVEAVEQAVDEPVELPRYHHSLAPLPRRDADARAHLAGDARRARPVVLARERMLPVPGALGELLPDGGLRRGEVVTVEGATGAGATSLALALAAAATAGGEWAAAVAHPVPGGAGDGGGSWGAMAAAEAGVVLARFAVVRRVPPARWATVVAALLDGVSLVLAEVPRSVRVGDARRLVARARERAAVLVPLCGPEVRWPADAALRLRAEGGTWPGLGAGSGLLAARDVRVHVEGRGMARRARVGGARTGRSQPVPAAAELPALAQVG